MEGTQNLEIAAEIAARYGAVIPAGLTVKVIPRGVSGIPELGMGEHWRVAMKRQADRAKASRALARRLAEADNAAARDDTADRAQMFADIAVKVARAKVGKPSKPVTEGVKVRMSRSDADDLAERLRAMVVAGQAFESIIVAHGGSERVAREFCRLRGIVLPPKGRKMFARDFTRVDALRNAIEGGADFTGALVAYGGTERGLRAFAANNGITLPPKPRTYKAGRFHNPGHVAAVARHAKFLDRKAIAKAMHAAGSTVEEIAVRLGVKAETVRRDYVRGLVNHAAAETARNARNATIVDAVKGGMTHREAAKHFGVGVGTVCAVCQEAGIGRSISKTDRAVRYQAAISEGRSVAEIAEADGVHVQTVKRLLREADGKISPSRNRKPEREFREKVEKARSLMAQNRKAHAIADALEIGVPEAVRIMRKVAA